MNGWLRRLLGGTPDEGSANAALPEMPPADEETREAVLRALSQVIDPEIGIDIVALGMVRRVERDGDALRIALVPTSPACPAGPWLASEAEAAAAEALPELRSVRVVLVHDPPWSPKDMSESARARLGVRC